jgi:hypothetical protein
MLLLMKLTWKRPARQANVGNKIKLMMLPVENSSSGGVVHPAGLEPATF